MSWRLIALGLLAVALLIPIPAQAQRGGRGSSGPAMSPYGPVYNPTQNPDYKLRASNPAAYQQLMLQRQMQAAQQYQQQMMKQQQQLQKNQKGAALNQGAPTAGQGFGNGYAQQGQMPQNFRKGMAPGRFRPRPKATTRKKTTVKKAKTKVTESEDSKADEGGKTEEIKSVRTK